VHLPLQPARALRLLLENAGALVTREQLRHELWGDDVFVDHEAGLAACINQVRTALGDRASSPRFIETLPRQGYRFIAEVRTAAPGIETPQDAGPSARPSRRHVLAGVLSLALGLLVLTAWAATRSQAPARELVGVPSVVVLPIETPPGEARLAAIADTLTEGVIGELATLAGPRARVASRVQTESLRGREIDLAAIRALGADYFVAITLRHLAGPVRVHAKLAHGTGWILWSTDFDLAESDLATLQTDLAVTLARKAAHEIVPPNDKSAVRAPRSAAVADYAQANSDFAGGRLAQSIEGYTRALRADPRHLGSYDGLAEAHLVLSFSEPERAAAHFGAAQAAVDRALALDASHAGALTAQGALALLRDFAPERAERTLRRAVELEPGLASARLWHAEVLAARGEFATALAEAEAGRDLDPLSRTSNRTLGHVQLMAGRYAELRTQTQRILALEDSSAGPHLWRAFASERLGDEAEAARARRAFVAALGLAPRAETLSWDEVYAALAGTPEERWPWLRAVTAALAGRRTDALHWLEVCRRRGVVDLVWAAHNPLLETVRREPRFASVLTPIDPAP
jgi:DNA-binding winged helix-turn-helix (wHTH) protein/TolB-like protein/Flp pilus assembly protein TadD